jgi:hypothetical protein
MTFGAIVMACNAGHAPYALCLAEQIAEAHPNRDFDICIFSDEILEIPQSLKGLGVRVVTWSDANPFVDAPNLSRHGRATWLRLLVPQALAGQYERVLYLDSDILLRGEGIGSLLAVDLGQNVLGAVRDQQQWRRPWRQVEEFRRENLPVAAYFNAGVLLIDVARFNAEDVLGASVGLMGRRPGSLLRHDQSVLNLVLRNRWTELSPVWNWQFTAVTRFHMQAAPLHRQEQALARRCGKHARVLSTGVSAVPASALCLAPGDLFRRSCHHVLAREASLVLFETRA